MSVIQGWLRTLLALLVAVFIAGSEGAVRPSAAADEAGSPGVRRALLIGINKYQYVPQLQGSINDIETMRLILTTRYGFSPDKIKMVKDTEATRAGIIAALEGLIKEAGPDDVIYLHYSGHGSQVKDLNGDEEDGLDETLIPQDGRGPNVPDILDDELDEMLSRLRARTALIVLDSCHSGTATRSVALRTRSVPQESDARLELYKRWSIKTRAVVPLPNTRYVLMTGAASHQPALDGPVEGRYHGLFTYALSKSLSSAAPEATPYDVFGGVTRELKRVQTQLGLYSMPEPQLEGPKDRLETRPVLPLVPSGNTAGGSTGARQAWAEVQPAGSERVVLVDAISLGAVRGSVWAIYSPDETRFSGRAKALAVIDGAEGKNATAFLEPAGRSVQAASRAILLAPAPASGRVAVLLRDVPADRRTSLENSLQQRLGNVDFVKAGTFARFVVDMQGDQVMVFGADGLHKIVSYRVNDAQWTEKLATVVSRSVTASELMALDNPSSRLRVEARVVSTSSGAAPAAPLGQRGVQVVQDLDSARYKIRRAGDVRTERNSLQLEIQTSADCYLTVVDVDSQGGVNLLFPTEYQRQTFYPNGAIRGGATVRLPDSLQAGNQAGFHWDYSPPSGADTVRVFCSTDLETANMLRQQTKGVRMTASLDQSAAPATRGLSQAKKPQSSLTNLRSLLVRRRGLIVVPDEPEQPIAMTGAQGQTAMTPPGPVASLPPQPVDPSQPTYGSTPVSPQGSVPQQSADGAAGFQPTAPSAPGAVASIAPPVQSGMTPEPPSSDPALQSPGGAGQASYASMAVPDWTAASVTVVIED